MHWTCFSVKKDRTIASARRAAGWRVFPGINVAKRNHYVKMWTPEQQSYVWEGETDGAANPWLMRRSPANGNKIYSFCVVSQ